MKSKPARSDSVREESPGYIAEKRPGMTLLIGSWHGRGGRSQSNGPGRAPGAGVELWRRTFAPLIDEHLAARRPLFD